jgi:DNA-3-methyladenine glycosylase
VTPKLSRDFYVQDTVAIARALIGCVLWRRIRGHLEGARIVETEAYLGANDAASHARRGLRSERNQSMYLAGGHAYVYLSYGMHWCMNVVTQEQDTAEAVLLRAAQPVAGVENMWKRRPKAEREYELMNGPGKLCAALMIDRRLDGEPLDGDRLFLCEPDTPVHPSEIAISKRVGVDNSGDAAHWPLRFFINGSRYVSAHRYAR